VNPAARTQAERTEATTGALVAAARELFAADGYAATSIDAVAAKAGVTKGAVYHHFKGKPELFAAVFAAEVEDLTDALTRTYARQKDPWKAFKASCEEFFESCREPGRQRIFLLDAQGALGWEKIRQLEAGLMDLMRVAIQRAVDEKRVRPLEASAVANLLFGAMCEGVMVVARAPYQDTAQEEMLTELRRLLDGLAR
jgi:AcrR family transcriptional regulator